MRQSRNSFASTSRPDEDQDAFEIADHEAGEQQNTPGDDWDRMPMIPADDSGHGQQTGVERELREEHWPDHDQQPSRNPHQDAAGEKTHAERKHSTDDREHRQRRDGIANRAKHCRSGSHDIPQTTFEKTKSGVPIAASPYP
jgi:hypothetical protein